MIFYPHTVLRFVLSNVALDVTLLVGSQAYDWGLDRDLYPELDFRPET